MLYLAAITGIDQGLYEAAAIDGAGSIPPLVEVEPDHLVRCFHYQGE